MGRLAGSVGSLLVYLCLGTVLAGAIVVGYAAMHGYLDKEKVQKMLEVARGEEVALAPTAKADAKPAEPPEQASFEDIERSRGIKARNLEMREQAVSTSLERIRFEQQKLTGDLERIDGIEKSIKSTLNIKIDKAKEKGLQNAQAIVEAMPPKMAKDRLLQMMDNNETNEVIMLLSTLSSSKRAKIINEIKTDEEGKKLDEILRLMRRGMPDILPINQARDEFNKFNPKAGPNVP